MTENNQFSEVFKQEAEELLSDIEDCILDIENNPEDRDAINKLFRAMHTIKGSGAMFGFENISSFTHHVETCLDEVREGKVSISKNLIDLILASRDQIKTMLDGEEYDQSTNDGIIAALHKLMDSPISSEPGNSGTGKADNVQGLKRFNIQFEASHDIFHTGMDPVMLLDELKEMGKCSIKIDTVRIPDLGELDPEGCYLSWDITLETENSYSDVEGVFIFVEGDSNITITELKNDISDSDFSDPEQPAPKIGDLLVEQEVINNETLGRALDQQKITHERVGEILVKQGEVSKDTLEDTLQKQQELKDKNNNAKQESIRVSSDKLDRLINLVGELVITQAQLTQISTINEIAELTKPVEEVERLTGELRDSVLNIRMMPIGTQFNRFRRLVRDLSKELNKEIDLITHGAETEMDKTVIERLADPLVHLIRNSLDHGIESPDIREAAGKKRKGNIVLSAEHRGASVIITIHDDGKGLDPQRILEKAISKGLVTADAELSEKEIFNLILAPGFSTAAQVTNISGRGVGMDVVKREIENLRGKVDIYSTLGKGTTITLSLPLTLAIIDGLLIEINSDNYVIPVSMVEECLEMGQMIEALSKDRNLIQVRGELVPYIRLRELFNIQGQHTEIEEAVIVNVNDMRLGIVVDHIIGDYQTVIKSLGKMYKDVTEISGATIMGNGNVALILDIPGIMQTAMKEELTEYV